MIIPQVKDLRDLGFRIEGDQNAWSIHAPNGIWVMRDAADDQVIDLYIGVRHGLRIASAKAHARATSYPDRHLSGALQLFADELEELAK